VGRSVSDLQADIRDFRRVRNWEQFHDPKNLTMLLASEVGELVAEFRWLTPGESRMVGEEPTAKARIAQEIGDVGIALISICDKLGIDFLEAIAQKLAINEKRYPVDVARGRPDRPDRHP